MKGIELPINILIIIAVAVIVLIALIAMFYPAFSSGSLVLSSEMAKTQACRGLLANDCNIHPNGIPTYNFDANKNGIIGSGDSGASCGSGATSGDNLWSLCVCQLQVPESVAGCTQCKKNVCGCTQNINC